MRHAPWLLLSVFACGGVLGALVFARLRAWRAGWLARSRNRRGKRGEQDAEALLAARGLSVAARQQRATYEISVDREPRQVDLVLDFLVWDRGERIAAEVKTGPVAPQLSSIATRRQLLEYQLATGARRVLLVDPERGVITEVAFPVALRGPSWGAFLVAAVVSGAIGAGIAAWWVVRAGG